MNIEITVRIEHSIAPETLWALEALLRAAPPLLERGICPENGDVATETPEDGPEHVVYPVHAPQTENKACSVCGNPIAASSKTGHCTSCAMKRTRAAHPRWWKKNRGEPGPAQPVPTACAECGGKIGKTNKSGYCIRCNMKHNRINPTARLPVASATQTGVISGSGLQDIVRESEPIRAPTLTTAPFCVHDRDPDTCIHCAQMHAAGMDTTRPARDRKADMKPARQNEVIRSWKR